MILPQQRVRIAQLRFLAKVCTYEMFVRFLRHNHMIYDEFDEAWIDFSFGEGVTSCISYDSDGTPYLSDYIQYWDEDEDEDLEFGPVLPIYFRSAS